MRTSCKQVEGTVQTKLRIILAGLLKKKVLYTSLAEATCDPQAKAVSETEFTQWSFLHLIFFPLSEIGVR